MTLFRSASLSLLLSVVAPVIHASPKECEIQNAHRGDIAIHRELFSGRQALVIESMTTPQTLGEELGRSFNEILNYLSTQGQNPVSAPIARYFSYAEDLAHFEAGFFVESSLPANGHIKAIDFKASEVAFVWFVGRSDESAEVYVALHRWMEQNNLIANGSPWEEYFGRPEGAAQDVACIKISYPITAQK